MGASYSHLQIDLRRSPNSLDVGTAPIIEGSSPRNEATANSNLDFAKHFNFDLNYRYVGALPAEAVHSYSTADARLAWQFAKQFELSVIGQNLLQPHHYEAAGDPGPLVGIKRNVYGQITWKR